MCLISKLHDWGSDHRVHRHTFLALSRHQMLPQPCHSCLHHPNLAPSQERPLPTEQPLSNNDSSHDLLNL